MGFRRDIPELLQAFDIFVFPSIKEGLPVAVIEAQAAGLPVVMSDAITDECIVTDLVESKPLSDSVSDWANVCINKYNTTSRSNTLNDMKRGGWDIYDAARQLLNYYTE